MKSLLAHLTSIITMLCSGCSTLMVPSEPRADWPSLTQSRCTSNVAGPIVDKFYGAAIPLAGLLWAAFLYPYNKTNAALIAGGSFAVGHAFRKTSDKGFEKAKECEELLEQISDREKSSKKSD